MFVDKAEVVFKAGDGGDGCVNFRHEKFVDRGGPDGGDGGNGGDIVLVASRNQNTLANFRYQKTVMAEDGKPGSKQRKHGKGGQDELVDVPVGTVALTATGDVVADLIADGQRVVVAFGGRGGFGNAHFVSSTRQAPRVAEKGEAGDEVAVILELKMIADVGLVGLPNAGKSTFLAATSNARPEIADYPFTTLSPNLGVVALDTKKSLLIADIPGLIEGASEGKGLGDEFLRHVERTPVLMHLIDIYTDDLGEAYRTIQKELAAYKIDLTKRPQLLLLTKIDGLDDEMINDRITELSKATPKKSSVFAISAVSGKGVKEALYAAEKLVAKAKKQQIKKESLKIPILRINTDAQWQVKKQDEVYSVSGRRIEKFAARTDFTNTHATQRLRDIMKKMGIMRELTKQGIKAGQKIKVGRFGSIEY